jgi:hypothetical protein
MYVYVCVYICMYACMYVCMYVCTDLDSREQVCIYMRTYRCANCQTKIITGMYLHAYLHMYYTIQTYTHWCVQNQNKHVPTFIHTYTICVYVCMYTHMHTYRCVDCQTKIKTSVYLQNIKERGRFDAFTPR